MPVTREMRFSPQQAAHVLCRDFGIWWSAEWVRRIADSDPEVSRHTIVTPKGYRLLSMEGIHAIAAKCQRPKAP